MTLRFLAALLLMLGVAALFGYLNLLGKGPLAAPELRHMRRLKERRNAPASFTPVGMSYFQTLPSGWPLASYATLESRGVSIEGYVQRILRSMDDDVHLEIAVEPRAEAGNDTAYVTAEMTPYWRRGSARWSYEGLGAAFRVNHGSATPWDGGPRRVRVSGWLLYDFQYDYRPGPEALRLKAPRVSGWEIHPITRIELWDEALSRYVDYPR